METGSDDQKAADPAKGRGRLMAGLALIAIGTLILIFQAVDLRYQGPLALAAIGLIFLLWGIGARVVGPLIPGGILSGIALGSFLIEGPFGHLEDPASGGVFVLAFAAGWVLITVLSAAVAGGILWWPLIPGGVLAVIGGALLIGGSLLRVVVLLGDLWPLGLIAAGLYFLFRRRRIE